MIEIQEINFPSDCEIINNDFYDYDPLTSFNKADSKQYLHEDLLQCSFPIDHLIIDLGWYGDVNSNQGEFRIQVIQNENWDNPFNVIYSKSSEEVKEILTKILHYYTSTKVTGEDE